MSTCQHVPSICCGFGCSLQGPSSRGIDTIKQAFLTPRDLTGPVTNRHEDPRIPYAREVFGNYKATRQFNANGFSSKIEVVPGTFHTFTVIDDDDDGLDQGVERDTAGRAFLELAVIREGVASVTPFHSSHGLQLALEFNHSNTASAEERRTASARIVPSKQETRFKFINSPVPGAAQKEYGRAGYENFREQTNREHPADRFFALSRCENNNADLETGVDGGEGLLGSKRRHLGKESSIHSGLTAKRFRPNSHYLLPPWSPVTHPNSSQLEQALIRHSSLSALSIFSGDNILTRTKDEQASLSAQFEPEDHSPSLSWGLGLKSPVGSSSGPFKKGLLPEVAKSEGGSCQQPIACASKTIFGISQLSVETACMKKTRFTLPCHARKRLFIFEPTEKLLRAMRIAVEKHYGLLDPSRTDDECWLHPAPPKKRKNGRAFGQIGQAFSWSDGNGNHSLTVNLGIIMLLINDLMTTDQKQGFIDHRWHLSHLCGNWTCFNWHHMTVEPGSINVGRNGCFPYNNTCKHNPPCMKSKKIWRINYADEEREFDTLPVNSDPVDLDENETPLIFSQTNHNPYPSLTAKPSSLKVNESFILGKFLGQQDHANGVMVDPLPLFKSTFAETLRANDQEVVVDENVRFPTQLPYQDLGDEPSDAKSTVNV